MHARDEPGQRRLLVHRGELRHGDGGDAPAGPGPEQPGQRRDGRLHDDRVLLVAGDGQPGLPDHRLDEFRRLDDDPHADRRHSRQRLQRRHHHHRPEQLHADNRASAGTTYYWEVHALGTSLANAGYWSTEESFATATAVTPLPAPILSNPASGATGVSTTTGFSWSQVTGNQGYRIIVSTNSADLTTTPTQTGGTPANGFNVAITTIGQNSYTPTTAVPARPTYWEVHALGTSWPTPATGPPRRASPRRRR